MTTFTLTTDISRIVIANSNTIRNRTIIIQNQSTTKVGLKLDGASGDTGPLSSDNCFILQPGGSAGDAITISGPEADVYIDAIGFSGDEVVNVQIYKFNNK